jgi:hypothetical protein
LLLDPLLLYLLIADPLIIRLTSVYPQMIPWYKVVNRLAISTLPINVWVQMLTPVLIGLRIPPAHMYTLILAIASDPSLRGKIKRY